MNKSWMLAGALGCMVNGAEAAPSAPSDMKPVTRVELMTADIQPPTPVSHVRVQELTLASGIKAPLHLHPCPTMGVVREGEILFQIEGRAPQHLKAGDAFYEPVNMRIVAFNNEGTTPAKFTVFYLLKEGEQETLRLLPR